VVNTNRSPGIPERKSQNFGKMVFEKKKKINASNCHEPQKENVGVEARPESKNVGKNAIKTWTKKRRCKTNKGSHFLTRWIGEVSAQKTKRLMGKTGLPVPKSLSLRRKGR